MQCSSSCGNGTRIRNVSCINAHGMKIEAKNCSLLTKPDKEENCSGKMCTYKWTVSDWNNVSVILCHYLVESDMEKYDSKIYPRKITL